MEDTISKIIEKARNLNDPLFLSFFYAKQTMQPTSFKSYFHLLSKFDAFLAVTLTSVTQAETKDCSEFIRRYSKHSMKTRKSYKIILQSFFSWLQDEGLISRNPAKGIIDSGDSRKKEKLQLTDKEFKKISSKCEGLREATIVNFLWYTGVRAKEICHIKVSDINLKDRSLFVSVSKSSMGNRPIPIHRGLFLLLQEYIEKRKSFHLDHDYLFINTIGTPLRYRTLLGLLHRISNKKFSAHSFRRALVTEVYNKSKDIRLAQQIAGHASIETTQGYILGDKKRLETFRDLDL